MPKHPLDPNPETNGFTFNGKVVPSTIQEFVEGRPSGPKVQATTEDGVPLWLVGVRSDTENFGEEDEEVIKFEIPMRNKPVTTKNAPAALKRPFLSFYAKRTGELKRFYTAEGIVNSGTDPK